MLHKQRWIYGALLLFVTSMVFAASNANSDIQISSAAVDQHTDLSIQYLSQLFGNVGNLLTSSSGQLLGKMFYEFNIGVLVVAGLWLCYTIFTISVTSAMEGSFMGQKSNLVLTFLKIAIGIGALIPSPSTGYSVIQDIVMKVVVQSVKFADMTWSSGVTYLSEGGAVWQPPQTKDTLIDKDGVNAIYGQIILPIFYAEGCMVANSIQMGTSGSTQPPSAMKSNNNQSPWSGGASGSSGGVANTKSLPPMPLQVKYPYTVHSFLVNLNQGFAFPSAGSDTGCGYLNWNTVPGKEYQDLNSGYGKYLYQAAQQAVTDIMPIAQTYACTHLSGASSSPVCAGVDYTASNTDVGQKLLDTLLAYVKNIVPIKDAKSGLAYSELKDFFTTADYSGWIMAGRYSWDLSHLKLRYQGSLNYAKYAASMGGDHPYGVDALNNPLTNLGSSDFKMKSSRYYNAMMQQFNTYTGSTHRAQYGENTVHTISGAGRVFLPFLSTLLDDLHDLEHLFINLGVEQVTYVKDGDGHVTKTKVVSGNSAGDDPIFFLQQVGVKMMDISSDIWVNLGLAGAVIMLIGIVCQSTLNLDSPIEMAINWFKPLAMAIAGLFVATGGMFAFYVPLYPFFIFLFGVIAWFIMVIEAMVAAPLIAFGLTHPEGQDFLGPAKQGLMLLLGIFLRPALMVIGLFAAMILAFVSFRLMNSGFAGFVNDLFVNGNVFDGAKQGDVLTGLSHLESISKGGGISGFGVMLFGMPVLMVVYATVVYLVLNQCYSLVYVLPDYIMRWIGAPQSDSKIGQVMEQIKGVTQQNSGEVGKAAGQTVTSVSQGVRAGGKMARDKIAGGKPGGGGPGGGGGMDVGGGGGGGGSPMG